MTNEHDPEGGMGAREDTQPGEEPDESPENLPIQMWVTLGLFALFVVAASGCFGSMFLR